MEALSSVKLLALVPRYILVACLIQSNYAEVCYLRSHRGYGGCMRWFLPAEKAPNCTSIRLGGYTTTFYKRSQVIEFRQPFVSYNDDEVQEFLQKRGVKKSPVTKTRASSEISEKTPDNQSSSRLSSTTDSLLQSDVAIRGDISDSILSTQSPSQRSTDQQFLTTTVIKTTQDDISDSALSTHTQYQPTTAEQFLSTTVPDITCPSYMSKVELICAGHCDDEKYSSCNEPICSCSNVGTSQDNEVRILTCGCNSTNTRGFIPTGFTYFNETQKCHCGTNGIAVCNDKSRCDFEVESENWKCQIGNQGNQKLSRLLGSTVRPTGCHELYSYGARKNRIYCVYPNYLSNSSESALHVYCNMGDWPFGGWTVIQRRVNGSVNFYRNWTEYKDGFGELDREFWLGNENIYHLTSQTDMQLRIDIEKDAEKHFALYRLFRIGDEKTGYKLIALGDMQPGGIEYNALRDHVNTSFSTYDQDMDLKGSENCGETQQGGWWFTGCHMCYLNGVYGMSESPGIRWYGLPGGQYNIKSTEMKIMPVD